MYFSRLNWLYAVSIFLIVSGPSAVFAADQQQIQQRIDLVVLQLGEVVRTEKNQNDVITSNAFHLTGCGRYPYHDTVDSVHNRQLLLDDLKQATAHGLMCLSGNSAVGRLHEYHEQQAQKLLDLLESSQTKTIACVADELFANAIATGTDEASNKNNQYLSGLTFPAIKLDTYRIGGLLSRNFDESTYRDFFHLTRAQVKQHLTAHPLRGSDMHQFKNLPAMLFHEMVHWLGHEHSSMMPDLADLYETCCFGGSDYIDNADANRRFQQKACGILKDDSLWSVAEQPDIVAKVWRKKRYYRLKSLMRVAYE